MLERFFKDPSVVQRHRQCAVGPYLDSAAKTLVDAGYTESTVRTYLWATTHFGAWLTRNGLKSSEIDEKTVEFFLEHRRSQGTLHRSQAASIRHLLTHLREQGVTPYPEAVDLTSPAERLLRRYEDYLRQERGLTEATVVNYRPTVRAFLEEKFGYGSLPLGDIRPADVTRFLLRQAQSLSYGRARVMTSALRSLFRFLLQSGEVETDLAASVLPVARRHTPLTDKHLPQADVERVLSATCNRDCPTGQRDYSILLLLARLGLRAGEVVALELDHIDWRAGEITIPDKRLCPERLPLPTDVGEALAVYVTQVRPRCTTRRVFLRMRAPCRGMAHPSTVSTIVRRALERAEINFPHRGAHMLRHSLATGMLHRGAALTEIGQILRHRSAQTTELYAKVDFSGLRSLAQSWPETGGEQ